MSVQTSISVTCPSCGHERVVELYSSINVDRSPALRDAVIDRSLLSLTCEDCGGLHRVSPVLSYIDGEDGLWAKALPVEELATWRQHEVDTELLWLKSFGPMGHVAAQKIGVQLRPRLVFGGFALREKVLCGRHGIDDVSLELAKIAFMLRGGIGAVDEETDLRLLEVQDDVLVIGRVQRLTEEVLEISLMAQDAVDAVEEKPEAWAALREQVEGRGLFVDFGRTLEESPEAR